ncbi:MAG: response regulator transcription factor [Clostridia bacterium]|nr:response regulator transcription factor [Clostridia bacterium]
MFGLSNTDTPDSRHPAEDPGDVWADGARPNENECREAAAMVTRWPFPGTDWEESLFQPSDDTAFVVPNRPWAGRVESGEVVLFMLCPLSLEGRLIREELGAACQRAHTCRGRSTCTNLSARGAEGATGADGQQEPPRLTVTERAVVRMLAQGKTNSAIAKEMYVSINTVKTHVRSVFQKLGVRSRSSAVRYAVTAGLID